MLKGVSDTLLQTLIQDYDSKHKGNPISVAMTDEELVAAAKEMDVGIRKLRNYLGSPKRQGGKFSSFLRSRYSAQQTPGRKIRDSEGDSRNQANAPKEPMLGIKKKF